MFLECNATAPDGSDKKNRRFGTTCLV